MVKLLNSLKNISIKKMGKSSRRNSKAQKALREPTMSVVESVQSAITGAHTFESQGTNKSVAPTAVSVGIDPPVVDGIDPPSASVVIDNNDNMSVASASKDSRENMSVSSAEVDVIEEAPKVEEASVASTSKDFAENMSVSSAEVDAIEVAPKVEEVVEEAPKVEEVVEVAAVEEAVVEEAVVEDETKTEEVAEAKTEEEVATPTEAAPEAEATDADVDVEEEEEEEEADLNGEAMNLEPSIEIVQQNDKVAIGFYQAPPSIPEGDEEAEKEAEEYGVMAHTMELGAQLMDQYFSCFPSQNATVEEPIETIMIDTAGSKKEMSTVHVIEDTEVELTPQMDDRNDCAAEENSAIDEFEEAYQEIRV
eukprot:CAMPEP_0172312724 /NCGR_PEP_ID=MMETSP1058-20130122/18496_1 /TAXON_ID=83371 /ORGANISM="Detonula confervacea, Strain CCMP 353" /LENGTH=364 /DNA_ID=CAMNT_0013026267 /DNA_START=57 /DNA_END=1151 /DNA_ORIENTATION=-